MPGFLKSVLRLPRLYYVKYLTGFKIPEAPHFDETSSKYFSERIRQSHHYLEYGSGGSTRLAAAHVSSLVSVDSDQTFLNAVAACLPPASGGKFVELIYADIGLTGEWGFPLFTKPTRARVSRWKKYPDAPWEIFRRRWIEPDTILVDGRFRVACTLVSVLRLSPGSDCLILLDDYLGRPEYLPVEEFVDLVEMQGRMAVFKKKKNFDEKRLVTQLEHYYSDPG